MVVPVLCTKAAEVAPEQLARQAMVTAHAADDGSGGDDTIVGAGRRHGIGTKEEGKSVELDALIYMRGGSVWPGSRGLRLLHCSRTSAA